MTYSYENGVITFTREDGATLSYPYNTETQKPFISESEALTFANSRPKHFTPLPTIEELKSAKVFEIDKATAEAITALVGNDINQRNLTAKSVQLTLKVANGTITAEEETTLAYLDGLFAQVEELRISGNDKEAQILACTTKEEFEAKCIELGV